MKLSKHIQVLSPEAGQGFDIGNTGANVAYFVIPQKCTVVRPQLHSNTAVGNSFTVSFDSYVNESTQGAEDIGKIIVPDSTGAFRPCYDRAGNGVTLNAGDRVLVQVDEAGDTGEEAFAYLLVQIEEETEDNQSRLVETA